MTSGPPPAAPIEQALAAAAASAPGGARPRDEHDAQTAKKNYAQALSNALASLFADRLRSLFPDARVTPRPDGTGQEHRIGAAIDRKKTDVGVWDDAAGLILGVSIKTYSFRDFSRGTKNQPAKVGRYQKNVVRNDLELRAEAAVLHRRQPYAVLVGVLFTPREACWDSKTAKGNSSFAHMVFTFRKRVTRVSVDSPRDDLFEAVYIGLYTSDGDVEFFDVARAPRRNQPPPAEQTLTLDQLIDQMSRAVLVRNQGVTPEERYTPDDPDWTPPPLPAAFDEDASAPTLEEALEAHDLDDDTDA